MFEFFILDDLKAFGSVLLEKLTSVFQCPWRCAQEWKCLHPQGCSWMWWSTEGSTAGARAQLPTEEVSPWQTHQDSSSLVSWHPARPFCRGWVCCWHVDGKWMVEGLHNSPSFLWLTARPPWQSDLRLAQGKDTPYFNTCPSAWALPRGTGRASGLWWERHISEMAQDTVTSNTVAPWKVCRTWDTKACPCPSLALQPDRAHFWGNLSKRESFKTPWWEL